MCILIKLIKVHYSVIYIINNNVQYYLLLFDYYDDMVDINDIIM